MGVVQGYRRLHGLGVVHRSPGLKHWLWDGEGVRLIDFGRAVVRDAPDVPRGWGVGRREFARLAKEEMGRVRELLYAREYWSD
jgi:hypothetical protein